MLVLFKQRLLVLFGHCLSSDGPLVVLLHDHIDETSQGAYQKAQELEFIYRVVKPAGP